MPLKTIAPIVLFLSGIFTCPHVFATKISERYKSTYSDSTLINEIQPRPLAAKFKPNELFAGNCYDINWATWSTFSDVTSINGSITDADGSQIGISLSANYTFGSTPSIYTYSKFSGYPSSIPNSTVPKTTWAAGSGGTTTMCFSKKVTNPVLLLSSLGSTLPSSSQLNFSIPYVVLYDGGGMVYNNSTTITGTEGYAIIMFPGEFTCVTINSNTPESYTNLTWGIRPQPFAVNIADNGNACGSATVTASGGVAYNWNGGDTPNQATNTFHQSGTYLVTITNIDGCITSASKIIVIDPVPTTYITAFSLLQQSSSAIIDHIYVNITITVPAGTDLRFLRPELSISADATVTPASGATVDFTHPVDYEVTNDCGSVKYRVTIKTDNIIPVTNLSSCPDNETNLVGDALVSTPDSYSWQILRLGSWVDASGTVNQANYTALSPENLTGLNQMFDYRRRVTTAGNSIYDSYYRLAVTPSTSQNVISVNKHVACGSGVDLYYFTGNSPQGNTPSSVFQWQTSADGINWQENIDKTSQNWELNSPIIAKTWFRRVTTTGSCPAYSNVLTIDYIPAVTIAVAGNPRVVCGQTQLTLNANTPRSTEVGTWSVISPSGYNPFTNASVNNPGATINNLPFDTDIELKWSITESNCSQLSENTVRLRSSSLPVVNAGNDIIIDRGESIILNGSISSGSYTFKWLPAEGLSDVNVLQPVASPLQTTTYTLAANNGSDCSIMATVKIIVKNDLIIPNAFTPNEDGVNDSWNIKNIHTYNNINVFIYNRWGQQVFYSKGYPKPWDAIYNGKKLAAGVYYYLISSNDTHLKKAGSVTLIY